MMGLLLQFSDRSSKPSPEYWTIFYLKDAELVTSIMGFNWDSPDSSFIFDTIHLRNSLSCRSFVTHGGRLLCKHCVKLMKSKQNCGICKKIWHHSDGGSWVCCDGCDVWVHAECAKLTGKHLKDLESSDYYCPDCKPKFDCHSSLSDLTPKVRQISQITPPGEISVLCNGMEGTYIPSLHVVVCKYGSCGTRKRTLGEWEQHTCFRAKKWKCSVKV